MIDRSFLPIISYHHSIAIIAIIAIIPALDPAHTDRWHHLIPGVSPPMSSRPGVRTIGKIPQL